MIFLLGPTASGKSRLAMEVARVTGAELCALDAFQVYRGLDIGTAKPTAEERRKIPHHLLDLAEPEAQFTAADYLREAGTVREELRQRAQPAVWVGGTGLYHRVLTEGLAKAPGTDPAVAAELEKMTMADLVGEIRQVDPEWSEQADLGNRRRILRALAVWRQTARKMSSWQKEETRVGPMAGARTFALIPNRDALGEAIRSRVAGMMREGWAEEVRRLRQRPGWEGSPGSRAIGYREIGLWLAGKLRREEAEERITAATRAYAKRQLTWLKRVPNLQIIEADLGRLPKATGVEKLAQAMGERVVSG